MEFVLRCNNLRCRQQLHDQAVVTTCSHVFCTNCADSTRLSQPPSSKRHCPACETLLANPDDVVVAGLNPSEDYKTSVLSGLSPTIIMECASRGLSFYSYQASQEIVYQEHLAKSLTDKYTTLNQQMDQLIHDANTQIKMLQDKLQTMQAEQATLEAKNHELIEAFREKSRAQQQLQKLYQTLKAQVMASHVATAAVDEADHTLQSARPDRFVERLPGARSGIGNFSQPNVDNRQGGHQRYHNRNGSGSSGGGRVPGVGIGPGGGNNSQAQGFGLGGRTFTGQSAATGTPLQGQHRSRLPVLGGTRANAFVGTDAGPAYQPSPATRQPLGLRSQNIGGFGFETKGAKKR
ncbi:uncharacterized protein EI97DRAFT_407010 [Westerdykella ornata]|uniref:RING-type domain-containing protein n=1 Tax=Westerdykella ornata TaxID=318751 RepID=A0A6A6J7C7_WESOR|nr:uncharacterized protein EI97DRAFT_407010 [Westerdykella ornata]KAF2272097.1 hypothetical protein EI97DRAFT_407010 [Westerdykella ornata]